MDAVKSNAKTALMNINKKSANKNQMMTNRYVEVVARANKAQSNNPFDQLEKMLNSKPKANYAKND